MSEAKRSWHEELVMRVAAGIVAGALVYVAIVAWQRYDLQRVVRQLSGERVAPAPDPGVPVVVPAKIDNRPAEAWLRANIVDPYQLAELSINGAEVTATVAESRIMTPGGAEKLAQQIGDALAKQLPTPLFIRLNRGTVQEATCVVE